MKKVEMVVRILLGLMLLMFGLNKFLNFMPMEPSNEDVGTVFGALMIMGVMPVVALLEILGGLLLVINKQITLVLLILAPMMVNVMLFHIYVDMSTAGPSIFYLMAVIFLMYTRKDQYLGLLDGK